MIIIDPVKAAAISGDPIQAAFSAKLDQISTESLILQAQNLIFGDHQFHADPWATKTLESCLSVSLALGLQDTDPVRVPAPLQPGYWLTADLDANGNRIAIPITVGYLKQIIVSLYDRNGLIWGKQIVHNLLVETMFEGGALADEISAYDHTLGWD